MKSLVMLIGLLLLAFQSHAVNLVRLGKHERLVDVDSIHKVGKFVRAWTVDNMSKPQDTAGLPGFLSARSLHEIDCEERSSALVAFMLFDDRNATGNMVQQHRYQVTVEDRTFPFPGSPAEELIQRVCKR